jgi:Tol biopolymer transport system component
MKIIHYLTILLLFLLHITSAQYLTINKVQYKDFNWQYIQSEHFDVYFYQNGYDIAKFTAEIAEKAYDKIKKDFQYEIKDRISIIVYKSHNDFQQTNVIYEYLDEGVGGVTELFKNRVVVPFEGSYSQFRHVIHHELVHGVMNDMLYGGSIQSLIAGQVTQVPLWFAEGLAEYESLGWDTRLDMVVRDATISGYLYPIQFLDYLPYQGGASVFRYIAQKYGNQKIGEIINKIKGSIRFEPAFKSALGIDMKELTEEWQRQMKREYWPDIANRKESREFATALTDHEKDHHPLKSSPTISPQGDKMIYVSGIPGSQSIYLYDILEGKIVDRLIEGHSSVEFEDLHFLSPGMSWSPDGKQITFAAKAGEQDALYIYDITKKKMEQHKFDLDGLFSTAWSPLGNEIAFIGNLNGASDIYIFSLDTKEIQNITNDVFSDQNPSWSPDGQKIVFVSDRGKYTEEKYSPDEFMMHTHDFENDDIYIINKDGTDLLRITDNPYREGYPVFTPDGESIVYVSEESGISNIYLNNLKTDSIQAISNLLTGAFQLSWDSKAQKLIFASFYRGGWDIFMIKKPLELDTLKVESTEYFKQVKAEEMREVARKEEAEEVEQDTIEVSRQGPMSTDFSKYVFADMKRMKPSNKKNITLKESDYKSANGEYKVKKYKIKFSPDYINGAAGYSTYFGLEGFTQIILSDMLGNHKIYIGSDLVFDLRNSSFSVQYFYLPRRTDYGFGGFHLSNFFLARAYGIRQLIRYRNYGLNLTASYPFDKYTRLDGYLTWYNVNLEYLEYIIPTEKVRTILPGLTFSYDKIEWYATGPQKGTRAAISALISPKYNENSLDFQTLIFDYRKYLKLANYYNFAFRLNVGTSQGKNPQTFYLGGVPNWFNYKLSGDLRVSRIEEIFFSEFITPLRGVPYYEQVGHHFALFNGEFRFPFIPYIPLFGSSQSFVNPNAWIGPIQWALFTDIGSAWDMNWDELDQWKGFYKDAKGIKRTKDLVVGYGFGPRIFILGLLLKIDIAWHDDYADVSKPQYLIYLGADF